MLAIPGYRVVGGARPVPEEGLRNDVAAFLGPTDRGPLAVPVRIAGRHAYAAVFGRQRAGVATPRAIEAYFGNGGDVAWVVRTGRGGSCATAMVDLGDVSGGTWAAGGPARLALPGNVLRITATSPGTWADATTVRVTYRAYGHAGNPALDVRIAVADEPVIQHTGLTEDELLAAIGSSGLLTASFQGKPAAAEPSGPSRGPASRVWTLTLAGAADPEVKLAEYLDAAVEQAQIDEIAVVGAPDLATDLDPADHDEVVAALATAADESHDRLVVVATDSMRPADVAAWRERVAGAVPDSARKAVAAYAPWLVCENLTPGIDRYAPTTPVGHVCGVISRLDRLRGSGSGPANALVNDAIDIATRSTATEQEFAISQQVNLLRCRTGGGLELWGARTLDDGDGRHIAHRRLVHRIVRAVRRVGEPLAFDTNAQLLWFAVWRAVTGVLLEAFRSGFLQGVTPDQAYRVRCDETTNTPERIDAGEVVCEIAIAPAAPMEFITLRLTLGEQGLLEVVEQ